jgi:ATP synthase protein I
MAANGTGQDPRSPKDVRLESLDQRLDRIKAEEERQAEGRMSAESQRVIKSAGARILSVLIGYPLGGFLTGWVLDQWLNTFPWFSLGSMFLGFGLAFREVWRSANQRPKAGNGD